MKVCSLCGHENRDTCVACEKCGAQLSAVSQPAPQPVASEPAPAVSQPAPQSKSARRFCTACGGEVKEGLRFCTSCGAKMNDAPAVSQPAPAVSQPAPAVSQPAPAVSQPAPAVSQPAPAVSQPAPQPKPARRFCTVCGSEVKEGLRFCTSCGAKMNDAPAVSQPAPQPAPAVSQPVVSQPAVSRPAPVLSQPAPVKSAADKAKSKKTLIIVLSVVLAALIVIGSVIGIVVSCNGKSDKSGGSAKGALDQYFQAMVDKNAEAYAESLYPKGTEEYEEVLDAAREMFESSDADDEIPDKWEYRKTEGNDYSEYGVVRMSFNGEWLGGGSMYLQKSSIDNKWHVTHAYTPEFYDGKTGTGYANAVVLSDEGTIEASSRGKQAYGLYACQDSDEYTVVSDVMFSVKSFDTKNVATAKEQNMLGQSVYIATVSMTAGRCYYVVFESGSADYMITTESFDPGSDDPVDPSAKAFEIGDNTVILQEEEQFYRFVPGALTCTVEGRLDDGETGGFRFTLYDSDKKSIGSYMNLREFTYDFLGGRTYYIGVRAASSRYAGRTCIITIFFQPEIPGDAVAGDSAENAIALDLNKPTTVHIDTQGQVVWYSFTVSSSGDYRIYTKGNCDTYGEVYDSRERQIGYNDDDGDNNNFLIDVSSLPRGTYYVAVSLYSGTGSFTLYVESY